MRGYEVKNAMYTAYLLGFESSREGMNGEHGKRPASWYENRDQQIDEYLENHKAAEPAFPVSETVADGRVFQPGEQGMSLRDYLAAKAITAVMARHGRAFYTANVAAECYALADAMIAARGE